MERQAEIEGTEYKKKEMQAEKMERQAEKEGTEVKNRNAG